MGTTRLTTIERLETRLTLAGDLDGSFGTLGRLGTEAQGGATAIGQGRFLVSQIVERSASDRTLIARVKLLRPDGTVDPSYGSAGTFEAPFAGFVGFDSYPRFGVLPTRSGGGAFIVAGREIWKLTSTGRLDARFSGDGKLQLGMVEPLGLGEVASGRLSVVTGEQFDRVAKLTQYDATGRIVRAAVRLQLPSLIDPDNSRTPTPYLVSVAFDPTTGAPVGSVDSDLGPSPHRVAIARWRLDGTLDPTFAGDGSLERRVDYFARVYVSKVAADGTIWLSHGGPYNDYVERLTSLGNLSGTYEFDGELFISEWTELTSGMFFAGLDSAGNAYLLGTTVLRNDALNLSGRQGGAEPVAYVMRIRSDGMLDPQFSRSNCNGSRVTMLEDNGFTAVQPDGRGGLVAIDYYGTLYRFVGAATGTAGDLAAIVDRTLEVEAASFPQNFPGAANDSIVIERVEFTGYGLWDLVGFGVYVDSSGNEDGWYTATFSTRAGAYDRIRVNVAGGSDRVRIDASVTLPVTVQAGSGDDTIIAGSGRTFVRGGTGNDTIIGGAAGDYLDGGTGNDVLHGNGGNDMLIGGAGNDRLFGGPGNDTLFGDAGNDYLEAGTGFDFLIDRSGDDTLVGGTQIRR